jgi:hypothetical protein
MDVVSGGKGNAEQEDKLLRHYHQRLKHWLRNCIGGADGGDDLHGAGGSNGGGGGALAEAEALDPEPDYTLNVLRAHYEIAQIDFLRHFLCGGWVACQPSDLVLIRRAHTNLSHLDEGSVIEPQAYIDAIPRFPGLEL